jgi:hypothetical protein
MTKAKPFWTTLPGVLTGVAAILTALTGLYIAYQSDSKQEAPSAGAGVSPPPPPEPVPSKIEWPLVADETFSKKPLGWSIGDFPSEETPRFNLRVVNGNYRWDIKFSESWNRWVISPISSLVNFNVGVDFKMVEITDVTTVELLFSSTTTERYGLGISSNHYFGLSKTGADNTKELIIDWTPIAFDFNPGEWNSMNVLVDTQVIKFYLNSELLGEFRDPDFSGGQTGLSVALYEEGSAVIDFDNFQVRRKP